MAFAFFAALISLLNQNSAVVVEEVKNNSKNSPLIQFADKLQEINASYPFLASFRRVVICLLSF